jgi:pyridoxamine 5'-phosphate oxidase
VNWNSRHFDALLPQIWHVLRLACDELQHPFRAPVLGTAGAKHCELRTVILREAQPGPRLLVCHTDFRSPKIRDIQRQPQVQWLFHQPLDGVQIRASGPATIRHGDDLARQAWQQTPLPSRSNYCSVQPPGTPIAEPSAALPVHWRDGGMTVEQSEAGWPNFCVIVTTVERLEFLQLKSDGHHRIAFTWRGDQFDAAWIVP